MVYRIYVEKKKEYATEAKALLSDLRDVLGIKGLSDLRIINRYDVEDVAEEFFARAVSAVFSEPQVDIVSSEPDTGDGRVFAVEYLPGQFDQRADSAAQCIQLISMGARPAVRQEVVAEGLDHVEPLPGGAVALVPVGTREAFRPVPAATRRRRRGNS